MSEESEVQSKFVEFERLKERTESLTSAKSLLKEEIEEIDETRENLGQFKDVDRGEKFFFPLGSRTYGLGEITDTEKVLVNVGGDAIVKKGVPEAREILQERREQFEEQLSDVDRALQRAKKRLENLQTEIQKLQR